MDDNIIYKQVLSQIQNGILIIDSNANISYVNELASRISGINTSYIGKNLFEVKPYLNPEDSKLYETIKTGKLFLDYKQTLINFDGKETTLIVSTFPMFLNGEIIGAFDVWRDVTYLNSLTSKLVSLQHTLIKNKKLSLKNSTSSKYSLDDIISNDPIINNLKEKIKKISASDSPVLVYGETGTGKELFVQSIHTESNRFENPFIAQNCAAIPSTLLESILFGTTVGSFTGLFELADGGTLYLDEINSMDIDLQAKLLRVIQDGEVRKVGSTKIKKVNVRIIASINEKPADVLDNMKIRSDLFYRLNVISFEIPPLRDKREDIDFLVDFFILSYNKKLNKYITGISDNVRELFMNYEWPGNVRELKYAIESAMNFTDGRIIELTNIPVNICRGSKSIIFNSEKKHPSSEPILSFREATEEYEKQLIINALKKSHFNGAKAARLLKLPKQTFYNKMTKYNVSEID